MKSSFLVFAKYTQYNGQNKKPRNEELTSFLGFT